MTCLSCGREAENGTPAHWIGCQATAAGQVLKEHASRLLAVAEAIEPVLARCEHEGCSNPKKEWSGRGARPKYCAEGHK